MQTILFKNIPGDTSAGKQPRSSLSLQTAEFRPHIKKWIKWKTFAPFYFVQQFLGWFKNDALRTTTLFQERCLFFCLRISRKPEESFSLSVFLKRRWFLLSAPGWLARMANLDGVAVQTSGWEWWPGIGITLPSRRKTTSSLSLVTCGLFCCFISENNAR